MEENDKTLKALGFEVVKSGRRRYFRTPKPNRRHLHKMNEVGPFLEAENMEGRLLDVSADLFVFNLPKKRKGVGCEGTSPERNALQVQNVHLDAPANSHERNELPFEIVEDPELDSLVQSMLKLLQQPGTPVNHRLVNFSFLVVLSFKTKLTS